MRNISGLQIRCHLMFVIVSACFVYAATAQNVDQYIRRQMETKHIPGMSLVVLEHGKIVKESSYGKANLELNVPASNSDVYPIASITKVFTATSIFLLVQDGRLGLNDQITSLLPELPKKWSGISVLNCLTHTSGIPDIYPPNSLLPLANTAPDALKIVAAMPLSYPTGEKSEYTSTEYLILKMVVEKLSGIPYEQFLAKRIFEPLAMRSAKFGDIL